MNIDEFVLYKQVPAKVVGLEKDKIEILLADGKIKKVRTKDLYPLHPGPLKKLSDLKDLPCQGEEAWELLQGESPSLQDIAELAFGEFSPSSIWGAFKMLNRTPWFKGSIDNIIVRTPEEVETAIKEEAEKQEQEAKWNNFIALIKANKIDQADRALFSDLERYALNQSKRSKILKELGKQQSPENAHALLLKWGIWTGRKNPWPERNDMPYGAPDFAMEEACSVDRLDLTHLKSYAIDDVGNKDPDDAISYEDNWLWVHIADTSSLIPAGGEADREARGRAANLYIPEGVIPMLPPEATTRLGLGLQDISPALSFGFKIDEQNNIEDFKISFSRVKVERITYKEADERALEEPFNKIKKITDQFNLWRQDNGSITLTLPEVKIRVRDDEHISINFLEEYDSRNTVAQCMMMAGYYGAKFAMTNQIPIPYVIQPTPEGDLPEASVDDPASMIALRRFMKRSQVTSVPGPHSGMGLPVYTRVTSPLRRYSDLLVQQQFRLFLSGRALLSEDDILEGTASCESVIGRVIAAERASNLHWKLAYLMENTDWEGEGIVVTNGDKFSTIQIPSLALETRINLKEKKTLNTHVKLRVEQIDLPNLMVIFKVEE